MNAPVGAESYYLRVDRCDPLTRHGGTGGLLSVIARPWRAPRSPFHTFWTPFGSVGVVDTGSLSVLIIMLFRNVCVI